MKERHFKINIQAAIKTLFLLLLFSSTLLSARDRSNKKAIDDLNSNTLPPECSGYDLILGDVKNADIIYMNTGNDYPWYEEAVCTGKLISEINKHGPSSTVVTAHQLVSERQTSVGRFTSFITYLCNLFHCDFDSHSVYFPTPGRSSVRAFVESFDEKRIRRSYPNPDDQKYDGLHVIVGNDPRLFDRCKEDVGMSGKYASKKIACIRKRKGESEQMVFTVI